MTDNLVKRQDQNTGAVLGAKQSITNSRGKNLDIETTAFTAIAWM
jgi:hypothetical protein